MISRATLPRIWGGTVCLSAPGIYLPGRLAHAVPCNYAYYICIISVYESHTIPYTWVPCTYRCSTSLPSGLCSALLLGMCLPLRKLSGVRRGLAFAAARTTQLIHSSTLTAHARPVLRCQFKKRRHCSEIERALATTATLRETKPHPQTEPQINI